MSALCVCREPDIKEHPESGEEYCVKCNAWYQAGSREAMQALLPQPRSQPRRPDRNDPCPCGSGKKYKHCHGSPYL